MEATILAKTGLYDRALQVLATLLEKEKKTEYLLLKGKILVKVEKLPEATGVFLEVKKTDPYFDEAQKALRRIKEFTSGKRHFFNLRMKLFSDEITRICKIVLELLTFGLLFSLIWWNLKMNQSLQSLSNEYENSSLKMADKIEGLSNEIRNANLIGLKIDSLVTSLKDIQLKQMDSKINILETNSKRLTEQINKLKNKVDTLSRK